MTEGVDFLIVDDLEENLIALEALLRRDGLRFLRARSGEEALEILLKKEVALALLDVQMPGMDGFELAEYMRGNERTRHIPIVFLTAGTSDTHRRFRGYEAGAVDFIQKPIDTHALRSKAAVFFDLYEQRQRLAAQRDALERQAAALDQANRNKARFIAVLGHELRNPIMAVSAGLELIRRRPDPAHVADIRVRLEEQVGHMSRLIEDLLDLARIDQGKISLNKTWVKLEDVVASALQWSQPLVTARRHELVVATAAEPVTLFADHTRLSQVIANLLNNAAKYTDPGGRIELSTTVVGDILEIVVADDGLGIAPEKQATIFDIFVQAQDDITKADGLGVGLALVKQIVELHGGTISVASPGLDEGTCFSVAIPLAPGSASLEEDTGPAIAQAILSPGR